MLIDELNNTYGELKVIGKGKPRKKNSTWVCLCSCGVEKEVMATNLRNGSTKSCGCKSGGGYKVGVLGRTRIHTLDDKFFSRNTLKSNYWAGFIAADGNINKRKNSFSVCLAIKDKEHLEQLKLDLKATNPVVIKSDREFPIARFYVTSAKIKKDLGTIFNIIPAKSLVLKYPKFKSRKLEDAFICGYIDGDGYIKISKKPRIEILGTEEFLKGIKNRFEEILGLQISKAKQKGKSQVNTLIVFGNNARVLHKHYIRLKVPKLNRKWKNE